MAVWRGIPGIRDIKYLNTWSYRVMCNEFKNFCREMNKPFQEIPIMEELVENTFIEERTPENEFRYNEFMKILERKVKRLSLSQRQAVNEYLLNAQRDKRGSAGPRAIYRQRLRGLEFLKESLKNQKYLLQN